MRCRAVRSHTVGRQPRLGTMFGERTSLWRAEIISSPLRLSNRLIEPSMSVLVGAKVLRRIGFRKELSDRDGGWATLVLAASVHVRSLFVESMLRTMGKKCREIWTVLTSVQQAP